MYSSFIYSFAFVTLELIQFIKLTTKKRATANEFQQVLVLDFLAISVWGCVFPLVSPLVFLFLAFSMFFLCLLVKKCCGMQIFVNQAETKLRATSWSHELRPLSHKKREREHRGVGQMQLSNCKRGSDWTNELMVKDTQMILVVWHFIKLKCDWYRNLKVLDTKCQLHFSQFPYAKLCHINQPFSYPCSALGQPPFIIFSSNLCHLCPALQLACTLAVSDLIQHILHESLRRLSSSQWTLGILHSPLATPHLPSLG